MSAPQQQLWKTTIYAPDGAQAYYSKSQVVNAARNSGGTIYSIDSINEDGSTTTIRFYSAFICVKGMYNPFS
jgi:hypothetical protein